jgi:hypothetical protein
MLLLFMAAVTYAQITPSDDSYINSAASTTNYGTAVTLDLSSPADTAFIRFDLTAVPAGYTGASIAKATLKLYVNTCTKTGSFNVDLVNGAWTEKTIDYSNEPALGTTIAASVPLATTNKGTYVEIDITPALVEWLNGTQPNDGIALVANSPLVATFDSKENTATSHPPELDIVYASGGTITGVTTASGSGLQGGGKSGTLNLSLLTSCAGSQILQWSGSEWTCSSAGTGTITGVTAGTDLTGGGTGGNVMLNLDTTKVPQFATSNTFTGAQTINNNVTINGLASGNALSVSGATTGVSATGSIYGVYGSSADGTGVTGTGPTGVYGGSSLGYAVWGISTSSTGAGVVGDDTSASGNNYGVFGESASSTGAGVYGNATSTSGNNYGAFGTSQSPTGAGVFGDATSTSGTNYGVYGMTNSTSGYGVYGTNASGIAVYASGYTAVWGNSAKNIGVYGSGGSVGVLASNGGVDCPSGGVGLCAEGTDYGIFASSPGGWAGLFNGFVQFENDVTVSGNLEVDGEIFKNGGGFKIDHPLDPANRYLYHSFVESPDMKNIYDGVVVLGQDGSAWVTLPDYLETLNRDFRYQLTAIGAPGPNLYIAQEVAGNRFQIAGGITGGKVSWQVTGIRQDAYAKAHPIIPEVEKTGDERGKYRHPVELGMPKSLGIAESRRSKMHVPENTEPPTVAPTELLQHPPILPPPVPKQPLALRRAAVADPHK